MTPYQLTLLLHYYSCADDPPGNEPIRAETLVEFIRKGLLTKSDGNLKPTNKLNCYVDAVLSVPLPEAIWQVTFPVSTVVERAP